MSSIPTCSKYLTNTGTLTLRALSSPRLAVPKKIALAAGTTAIPAKVGFSASSTNGTAPTS